MPIVAYQKESRRAAGNVITLPDLNTPEKQQEIAALAYEFWLARGFRAGSPLQDLLQAHREIRLKTVREIRRPRPGAP